MSYDIRAGWLAPDVTTSDWAISDVEDGNAPQGVANISHRHEELIHNLTRQDPVWESHRFEGGDVELTHSTSTVQILITSHEVEGAITYGGSESQFEILWQCVTRLREAGATVWDPQQGREIRDTDTHTLEAAWTAYAQASAFTKSTQKRPTHEPPVPPRTFNRTQYLLLIILLMGILFGSIWVWLEMGLEARLPYFALIAFAVAFLVKMFALDPPRLRSIGMNEGLIFFNLIPPLMILIQLKLFCYPPQEPVVPIRPS